MEIKKQIVSRETLYETRMLYSDFEDQMEDYLSQLLWWNERVNLVSRDVSRETIREHIIHSLIPSALNLLNLKQWVDAGSGGGLPGIPLSIVEKDKQWILNDVVKKKIAAVRQLTYRLSLSNTETNDGSISDLTLPARCGIISKHAFDLNDLVKKVGTDNWEKMILYKGVSDAEKELEILRSGYRGSLFSFDFGEEEPFYKGKGLVMIEPDR